MGAPFAIALSLVSAVRAGPAGAADPAASVVAVPSRSILDRGPFALLVGIQEGDIAPWPMGNLARRSTGFAGMGLGYRVRSAPVLGLSYRPLATGEDPGLDLSVGISWTRQAMAAAGEDGRLDVPLANAELEMARVSINGGANSRHRLGVLRLGIGLTGGIVKPTHVRLAAGIPDSVGVNGIDSHSVTVLGATASYGMGFGHSGLGLEGDVTLWHVNRTLMLFHTSPGSAYETSDMGYLPTVARFALTYRR